MHMAAWKWVQLCVRGRVSPASVLEIGSRVVNGTVREIFPESADYLGVDVEPGPGVDRVVNLAIHANHLGRVFDVVVCCEVLEHCPAPRSLIEGAALHMNRGGALIVTAASPSRDPHSCDGGPLPNGEYYRDVDAGSLRQWIGDAGLLPAIVTDQINEGDVYALGIKP